MTPLVLDPAVLVRLRQLGGQELVGQIVGFFLRSTPQRLAILRTAFPQGDCEACELAAHALQSSAGNVGARQVQHLAGTIERCAERRQLDEIRPVLADLEAAWTRVHEALLPYVDAPATAQESECTAPATASWPDQVP